MDHLPLPLIPLYPPIEIRLIEVEDYDGGDFNTYPERQGWVTRTRGEWEKIFERPSRKFLAFLDRWLFFGIMHAFFGRIRTSDFVRYVGNPAYPVLTTKFLPHLLQLLSNSIKRNGGVADTETSNLETVLSKDGLFLNMMLMYSSGRDPVDSDVLSESAGLITFITTHGKFRDPRAPEMVMAISIVVESLLLLFASPRDHRGVESMTGRGAGSSTSALWTSLAWTQLREDGWCPSELVAIFNRFNTASFHFLHNLPRPGQHEQHLMIRVRKNPKLVQDISSESEPCASLCTAFKCAFKQLQDDAYQTKHCDGCPGCLDVVADPDELCKILGNGHIPLILSISEGDENNNIILVEAEPGMAYVAFSHVWSDGLGNLQRNALPRCQLLRLSNMVLNMSAEHSDTVLFWIDTICVPPDVAGFTEAQQQALTLMGQTYEDAAAVLVLDSWLFNSSSVGKSDEENLIRIFCCNWNARLWTYQEGSLAKVLHFQFSDAAYNVDRGIQRLCDSPGIVLSTTILHPLRERYHGLRGYRQLGTSIEQKLLAVGEAFGDRTTSVASDEALCLGVLLDLDVSEIARTEPRLRMEKFWRMLPTVPTSLVFTTMATFEIDGLRWAPVTFLRSPLNITDDGSPTGERQMATHTTSATLTPRGLTFQSPGLRFASLLGFLGEHVFVRDENGTWYHIHMHTRNSPDVIPYRFDDDGRPIGFGINPWESYGCKEVAMILSDSSLLAEQLSGVPGAYARVRENVKHMTGVLVAIQEEKDGTLYCRRLWTTRRRKLYWDTDAQDLSSLERIVPVGTGYYGGPIGVDRTTGAAGCIIGKNCPLQQQWCVG